MRPLIVVMPKVFPEDPAEVTFRHDQHPVQALASAAPDPPFGMCVRPRCHEWGQNHAGSVRAEDAMEAARDLPIVIITSVSLIPSYSSCQLRLRACCVTQAGLAQTYRQPTGHAGSRGGRTSARTAV